MLQNKKYSNENFSQASIPFVDLLERKS